MVDFGVNSPSHWQWTLNDIRSILARHIYRTASYDASILASPRYGHLYYTLHVNNGSAETFETSLPSSSLKSISEPIYTSELNPDWCAIPANSELPRSADPFLLRIWAAPSDAPQRDPKERSRSLHLPPELVLSATVDLSSLRLLAAHVTDLPSPLPPFTVIICLPDGAYGIPTSAIHVPLPSTRDLVQTVATPKSRPLSRAESSSSLLSSTYPSLSHLQLHMLLEHSEAIRELQARRSAIALKLDDLVNSAAQYEVVRPCEYSQTPPSPSLAVKNTESEEQRPSGLALLQDLRTATVSVHQTSITAHHVSQLVEEKTTSLRRMLYLRRVYTIAAVLQLQQVYQIRPPRFNNSSESGRQKGVSEFWTIDSLPLSHRDYVSPSPVTSDAALGTIAQCVDVLAQYLNINLLYPLQPRGSLSFVTDPISRPGRYPLHSSNSDHSYFEYAVYLLNKDIEQILLSERVQMISLPQALPNLYRLFQHFENMAK